VVAWVSSPVAQLPSSEVAALQGPSGFGARGLESIAPPLRTVFQRIGNAAIRPKRIALHAQEGIEG